MRKAFELNINMIEGLLDVCNNNYDDIEHVYVEDYIHKEKIIIRLLECMLMFNEDIYEELIEEEINKIIKNG